MLLNSTNTKHFIRAKLAALRPGWDVTQISRATIEGFEAHLRAYIIDAIQRSPSRGKTFDYVPFGATPTGKKVNAKTEEKTTG